MKQRAIDILCAVVIVAGIIICASDALVALGLRCVWQYIFNFAFIFLVTPACINLAGLPERLRPDLYYGRRRV